MYRQRRSASLFGAVGLLSACAGPDSTYSRVPVFEQPLVANPANERPTQRHVFGIRLMTVSSEMAGRLHLDAPKGLFVMDVEQGDAASMAGIRAGDVLLTFAGVPVNTEEGIKAALASVRPHDFELVEIWRDGEQRRFIIEF